ncbi:hypothetical protein DVK00_20195 [Haloarcula sp. Atlit-47R]|uniref:hypothetical protein n=1 Tax=Haloarcula sp. Atlit-47R TaxID=2282132 RepID=UPI000EF27FC8|nr:hypothetical protein [Haloarcula sp. Atlit-47R]RLM41310.1 hypothetical protein DVK00_20195 [Haloarcula sp. Atlit-47R]
MEKRLGAPHSDKKRRFGDAVITFEKRDSQLGRGVVVEVQHKNESKDIDAATADFIEQDYAVVWTDADDFGKHQWRMAEVDVRSRAQEAAWPEWVPSQSEWWQPPYSHRAHQQEWHTAWEELPSGEVPATLPPEWYDQKARYLWKQQSWDTLFPAWVEQGKEEYPATEYQAEVRDEVVDQSDLVISLPPDVIEPIVFRTVSWERLFARGTEPPYSERSDVSLEINIAPLIDERVWKQWYREGVRDRQSKQDGIDPPPTAFDDVQCHECGNYFFWKNGYSECQNCGTEIDWQWNIATGRISEDSVPEEFN